MKFIIGVWSVSGLISLKFIVTLNLIRDNTRLGLSKLSACE